MSSTIPFTGRRACTRSIQRPDRSASADRFASWVSTSVSKRPIWLVEAACPRHGPATHHPAHGRIMRQPVGIVHVLVPGQAPEHGLAELSNQGVASVRAGPGVRQDLSSGLAQAEGIIEFAAGEQPTIGRDLRSVELQLEAAVERDPKSGILALHPLHRPSPGTRDADLLL